MQEKYEENKGELEYDMLIHSTTAPIRSLKRKHSEEHESIKTKYKRSLLNTHLRDEISRQKRLKLMQTQTISGELYHIIKRRVTAPLQLLEDRLERRYSRSVQSA